MGTWIVIILSLNSQKYTLLVNAVYSVVCTMLAASLKLKCFLYSQNHTHSETLLYICWFSYLAMFVIFNAHVSSMYRKLFSCRSSPVKLRACWKLWGKEKLSPSNPPRQRRDPKHHFCKHPPPPTHTHTRNENLHYLHILTGHPRPRRYNLKKSQLTLPWPQRSPPQYHARRSQLKIRHLITR